MDFSPDEFHRTIKLELDEGRARTLDEAHDIVAHYVFQIDVGVDVSESETRQAILVTAVNAASRAFLGGVRVRLPDNRLMGVGWARGMDMATAVKTYGGEIVESLECEYPTLVIGKVVEQPPGSIILHTTWQGWSGGVVEEEKDRLAESLEFPLAGMLAAAIGVSEAFQHLRGDAVAGRRSIGLSLWEPQGDWRDAPAYGKPCLFLPKRLWLIGLGHLGQAYAWALGLLPYGDLSAVELVLQDCDSIVKANKSTGMLSDDASVNRRKTRVVAERLEALGFGTAITERRFDSGTQRSVEEPAVALVGVDDPGPRQLLEGAGFALIVDAGLGGGTRNYLDILIHAFPSGLKAKTAWTTRSGSAASWVVDQLAYLDIHQRLSQATELTDGEIQCGIIEVAGTSIGAAFVGCVAATFVLSEVLRALAGGPRFEVVGISLRTPHRPQISNNTYKDAPANPGFVRARTL